MLDFEGNKYVRGQFQTAVHKQPQSAKKICALPGKPKQLILSANRKIALDFRCCEGLKPLFSYYFSCS